MFSFTFSSGGIMYSLPVETQILSHFNSSNLPLHRPHEKISDILLLSSAQWTLPESLPRMRSENATISIPYFGHGCFSSCQCWMRGRRHVWYNCLFSLFI